MSFRTVNREGSPRGNNPYIDTQQACHAHQPHSVIGNIGHHTPTTPTLGPSSGKTGEHCGVDKSRALGIEEGSATAGSRHPQHQGPALASKQDHVYPLWYCAASSHDYLALDRCGVPVVMFALAMVWWSSSLGCQQERPDSCSRADSVLRPEGM